MSLFRKPTTPDDFNSNRFQPAPNVSGPLRTTPGDFGQYRTAPDNVGPTYLPGSIPKLAESDRNFANFTHHQCKQRKSKLSFIVLCLCRTHSPSAVGEQDGTIAATWSGAVLSALRRLLDTHVLEVDLAYPNGASASRAYGEGRHRRRQQMIPMMIFGVTVFGMFIIPIAFQFLTALSGKAFLMAKLALLLASMNGLKRVS
uniref:uncharacterized protein LOC120961641 n=1 Tax=Anopheles coluzzii TaxID=1518534 RepID=UPI0020FFEA1A|nr:uncharacterized protein LOC120961641 [Anopheles coluzzii]